MMLASDLLTRYSPVKKSEGNWGEINFRKGFWDYYQWREKIGQ